MTNAPISSGSNGAGPPPSSSSSSRVAGPGYYPVPRRSSYASVLSGNAASPQRSGAFSHLIQQQNTSSTSTSAAAAGSGALGTSATSSSFPLQHTAETPPGNRINRSNSSLDADMQVNHGAGSAGGRRSGGGLPSYSRQFAHIADYHNYGLGPTPSSTLADRSFFIPSYLRNSRYVDRLQAAHRSRLAAQRETNSSTNGVSLSASSSHVNLHRMAPSHRGMTYDIIEKEPVREREEEKLMPLPSRWNDADKYPGLDLLNDGLEVRYMGPPNKHDHEAAAVRADHPMPRQCGIYYFEVTILQKSKEGMIGVGFSSTKASVERLPGWEKESWAYHGDDGKSFFGESQGQGRSYGPTFTVTDTIGCGVNFTTGCAFFTKNGVFLGNAFRDLQNVDLQNVSLYPSVGMKKQPNVHLSVNFGQQAFIFDIDGMVKKEKLSVLEEISAASTHNLQPPLDESTLVQELVGQFLAHDGYVETAKAFAAEVHEESLALHYGQPRKLGKYEVEEDLDATNRQKIRAAILEGDIDKALKYTTAYYPNILQDNPQILFKLRCRKFLEIIRRYSDLSTASSKLPKSSHAVNVSHDDDDDDDDDDEDIFEQQMELDDQLNDGYSENDGMDTEEYDSTAKFHELLTEAVQYGQQLRMDYPSEERGGDRKFLDDIFSLVAYPDPKSSVHGHYLDPAGRAVVAEELNSAILVSLGKSSSAALERLYQQTEALINEISEDGGAAALINIRSDFVL